MAEVSIAPLFTEQDFNAGSLDDPSLFKPVMLLFKRDRPDWVVPPEGVQRFETMPD